MASIAGHRRRHDRRLYTDVRVQRSHMRDDLHAYRGRHRRRWQPLDACRRDRHHGGLFRAPAAERTRRRVLLRRRLRRNPGRRVRQRNGGAITGASWTSAGKIGGALSFDGVNDLVTVTDSASLDLTTGMTLEAWVRPTSAQFLAHCRHQRTTGQSRLRAVRKLRRSPSQRHRVHRLQRCAGHRPRFRPAAESTWTHLATHTTARKHGCSSTAHWSRPVRFPARCRTRAGRFRSVATGSGTSGSRVRSTTCASTSAPSARPNCRADMNTSVGGTTPPPPAGDTQSPSAPTRVSSQQSSADSPYPDLERGRRTTSASPATSTFRNATGEGSTPAQYAELHVQWARRVERRTRSASKRSTRPATVPAERRSMERPLPAHHLRRRLRVLGLRMCGWTRMVVLV